CERWYPGRLRPARVGGCDETPFAQGLDILFALDNEHDGRFQNFPQMEKNLPRVLLPNPPAAAIWVPLAEILGLIAHDLVQEFAVLIGVVVLGDNSLRPISLRRRFPKAAGFECLNNLRL